MSVSTVSVPTSSLIFSGALSPEAALTGCGAAEAAPGAAFTASVSSARGVASGARCPCAPSSGGKNVMKSAIYAAKMVFFTVSPPFSA